MLSKRLLAGLFAGANSISLIIGGMLLNNMALVGMGAVIGTSMMSFFVGESNGRRETGTT